MIWKKLFKPRPLALTIDSVVVVTGDSEASTFDDTDNVIGLNLELGKYFHLNDGGSHIWRLISEPRSVGEICSLLEREFDAEREQLHQDVTHFLESLIKNGMVTMVAHGQDPTADRAPGR